MTAHDLFTEEYIEAALMAHVELEPVSADQVVAGSPMTGAQVLATFGDNEIGVWEMVAGTMWDVEVDETFLVLAGSARVTRGDGSVIDIVPGSFVTLVADERTEWVVSDFVRKIYCA